MSEVPKNVNSKNSLFWKMLRGEAPSPRIAETLQAEFIVLDPDNKTLTVTFVAGEEFLNPAGIIQGGILSAMLDGTMGPGAGMLLNDNEFAPTLDLNINFIAPARPGKFTCIGIIDSVANDVIYASGELFDKTGTLVATATSTALRTQFKPRK